MSVLQNDIQEIISEASLFEALCGKSVLITGATGLIGSTLLRSIVAANDAYNLHIRPYGYVRDFQKAKYVLKDILDSIQIVNSFDIHVDIIIHTISPTSSKFFINCPVETITASVGSTFKVLELAKAENASVVYLSSMEQYGIPQETGEVLTEEKSGYIDHLNVRSSYSESKRICECLCASYTNEYGLNIKIARLAQTFGAGVALTDNRMPMQFAKSVVYDNDIVLHTEGKSLVNFVYLTDAITGILYILRYGVAGNAYNICNDSETRSVREIAEIVANSIASTRIRVRFDIKNNQGYAPTTSYYLNSSKLRALGWLPSVDIYEAYSRLVHYLHEYAVLY